MKVFAFFLLTVVASVVQSERSGRIVNGDIADAHQFPYQVALLSTGSGGTGLCGASVISSTAILTAAHCSDATRISFLLIFGAVNRLIVETNQQRRTVDASGWIQHPNYNQLTLANDVAVIRFPTEPVTLNAFVQVIALASDADLFVGEEVHVSGFGRYSDSSQSASDVLRWTIKRVITNLACSIRFPFLIQTSTLCAIGDDQINNAVCKFYKIFFPLRFKWKFFSRQRRLRRSARCSTQRRLASSWCRQFRKSTRMRAWSPWWLCSRLIVPFMDSFSDVRTKRNLQLLSSIKVWNR